MVKRKIRKLIPIIVVIVLVVGVFLYLRSKTGAPKVTTSQAEMRSISKTISASGKTAVQEGYTVRALVGGSIKEIKFTSGDTIKKGDVVIEMDKASLKSGLDTAYASYLSAKGDVDSYEQSLTAAKATESIRKSERDEAWRVYMGDNSENNKQAYKNAEALYQTALSSLTSLQDSKKTLQNASGAAYSGYASALNNYQNSTVKAPSDGQLALANVFTGTYVVSGQELFSITNAKNLVFKSEIDEADIGNIKTGMKASLSLDSYPGKTFEGVVENVDFKVVILTNGSAAVMADISFDTKEILPIIGLNGSADIEIDKSEEMLSITPDALLDESDKKYVFVFNQDKVFKKEVQIGFEGDDYVGIVSGLTDGDLVVMDPGSLNLTDGQKVKL